MSDATIDTQLETGMNTLTRSLKFGKAERVYTDVKEEFISYSGEVNYLEKRHGRGKAIDKKGIAYNGEFCDGKKHGIFSMVDESQNLTVYEYQDNRMHACIKFS